MQEVIYEREYVGVEAYFQPDGPMLPRNIFCDDGKRYEVERVIAVQQAASLKAGSQGDRYTVQILGKRSHLFFERSGSITGSNIGRWFVLRKRIIERAS